MTTDDEVDSYGVVYYGSRERSESSAKEEGNRVQRSYMDASLSFSTVEFLLQPPPAASQVYCLKNRREKTRRRRQAIRLHKWLQVELDKFEETLRALRALSDATHNSKEQMFSRKPERWSIQEISRCLEEATIFLDKAMENVGNYVSEANTGGDDVMAEVLKEVWSAQREIFNNQRRVLRLEMICGSCTDVEQGKCSIKRMAMSNDSSVDTNEGQTVDGSTIEAMEKQQRFYTAEKESNHDKNTTISKYHYESDSCEDNTSSAMGEAQAEIYNLREALLATQSQLHESECRAEALASALELAIKFEESSQRAEEQIEILQRQMISMTPRPSPKYNELNGLLGEASTDLALKALQSQRDLDNNSCLDTRNIAMKLLSRPCEPISGADETCCIDGPECAASEATTATVHSDMEGKEAMDERDSDDLVQAQKHLSQFAEAETDVDNNVVSDYSIKHIEQSETSTPDGPNNLGKTSLHQSHQQPSDAFEGILCGASVDVESLAGALSRVVGSTTDRYHALEETVASLSLEGSRLKAELETYKESERLREAARRRREEEAELEKKNAIQSYLDLLSSQGEEGWKDQLIGMGLGNDVPKLFRHVGKIRNKHLSKRDTEKMVKEVWKERLMDPAVTAGRASDLIDFLGHHLQKKVGISAAVIEVRRLAIYHMKSFPPSYHAAFVLTRHDTAF